LEARGADDDNLSIDARAAGAHDAVDATTMHRVDARWDKYVYQAKYSIGLAFSFLILFLVSFLIQIICLPDAFTPGNLSV